MIPSLFQFGFLALGLMAALALFLSLKREMQAQARKNRARVDELLERLQPAEPPPPHAEPLRSGINLNRRVQALRLLRRGEDVGHIAAALGVPRREVDLLVRVHRISARRAAQAAGS